ncbi:hypothetical protein COV04_00950 [Candidatus Uhrbacteria bacterium CG10_big_fil_rev_8_21_14_0_10_48_11]|uniref:Uncharacterized protein n=1 Tax=Candidatus Uhrbacteria bacterium CG10_big_fil_rev_8_21_14_0_10_48_11 TaxID=1975037 RepID=A0A2M8LF58_9BACT|nr:MAG: hypothetical protein COV04_00950 [Candidatus Uhrbacteria bacterium CG10_big_fil_rev_8_21_14_0_10_48_11]
MDEDIRSLLEENLQLARETHAMMKKVRRYMAMRTAIGFIYLLLIVAPVIFAIIYLPPLLQTYWQQYQDVLSPLSQLHNQSSSAQNGSSTTPSMQDIIDYARSIGVTVPGASH